MKPLKGIRTTDTEDILRKAAKLEPNKKSGKERHYMMDDLEDDDLQLDYKKRESVLDYFDDEE